MTRINGYQPRKHDGDITPPPTLHTGVLHGINARTVTKAQLEAMIRLLNVLGYEVTKK